MLQWKPDKHQALKKASDTRGWSVTCFFAPQRVSSHTSRAQSALGASHAMLHKLPSFARAPSHAQGDTCTCRWQEDVNTSCPRWPQGTASYTAGLLFLLQPPPWHRQVLPSSKADSNCSRRYGKCLGLCCKSNHFVKKSTSCLWIAPKGATLRMHKCKKLDYISFTNIAMLGNLCGSCRSVFRLFVCFWGGWYFFWKGTLNLIFTS